MFDPLLLRTFVAVAEAGGFTRGAERVGISQPTASQHVQRLEKLAGTRLIARDTRGIVLTDHGDAMLGFARSILAAEAVASAYFHGSTSRGRLRFGAADDVAATLVPDALRRFRRMHPAVTLELTVNLSHVLYRRLRAGHLDLIYIKQFPDRPEPRIPESGTVVRSDRYTWMAHPDMTWDASSPVPLVVYPSPTYSRARAIEALEREGRPWRVTCTAREVNGLIAAVRAGLGVAPYPQSLMPDDLVRVDTAFALPDIGDMNFTLLSNPLAPTDAVQALVDAIRHRAVRRFD